MQMRSSPQPPHQMTGTAWPLESLPTPAARCRTLDWSTWGQDKDREVRAATAALLGRLTGQPLHGPRVALVLQKLFPPSLVSILQVQARCGPLAALLPISAPTARLWRGSCTVCTCQQAGLACGSSPPLCHAAGWGMQPASVLGLLCSSLPSVQAHLDLQGPTPSAAGSTCSQCIYLQLRVLGPGGLNKREHLADWSTTTPTLTCSQCIPPCTQLGPTWAVVQQALRLGSGTPHEGCSCL